MAQFWYPTGELRVPVTDHELELFHTITKVRQQVPRLLGDPVSGRMGSDAEDVHPAGRGSITTKQYSLVSSMVSQ